MKKILMLIIFTLFLTGCGKNDQKSVTNKIIKDFNNSSGYKISGELEITNNDDVYNYDVSVGFNKKNNYYKVVLKNQSNDFKQIILKNKDGVYLYTPSLNKSFKFSNNWPYNNSQVYLYDTIINDIKKDENKTFSFKDSNYIYTTKVNYSNNAKLSKQKIIFDKNYKIKMVVIYNNKGETVMKLTIDKIKMSPKFNNNYFKLDDLAYNKNNSEDRQTMSIDDVIYPLVIPAGTKLVDEKKIKKDNGQRVIMTYEGEKNFLLVEETVDVFNEYTTISSGGVPCQLLDTIGVMTDNSLSWTSGNLEYYLISDMMNPEELVEVAQSMVRVESFK